MARKKSGSKTTSGVTGPEPQQLKAVHRAMENGDYDVARRRLNALIKRFPDFLPLYGLACETELDDGAGPAATLIAWEWVKRAPKGVKALEHLVEAADYASYPALLTFAENRLAELRGEALEPPHDLSSPFGPLSFTDWLATDLANMFTANERYDDARVAVETSSHPIARHQLVMACFAVADVAGAAAVAEQLLASSPAFLSGVERAIRLRLYRDGFAAAGSLSQVLRTTTPQTSMEACSQVAGLLLLNDDAAAEAAWLAAEHGAYWESELDDDSDVFGVTEHAAHPSGAEIDFDDDDDDEDDFDDDESDQADSVRSQFYCLGAFSALAAGNAGNAETRAQTALELDNLSMAADELLVEIDLALAKAGPPDLGHIPIELGLLSDWLPACWFERLPEIVDAATPADELPPMTGAHLDYLAQMVRRGGSNAALFALFALRDRVFRGEDAARSVLQNLSSEAFLPDTTKTLIADWLAAAAP